MSWRKGAAALAALAFVLAPLAARAEVAAVLDDGGRYVRTDVSVVRDGRTSSVWLVDGRRGSRTLDPSGERIVLNETGALRGDGVPSVVTNPITGLPWAVWSFNDDGDQELAVSLFDGRNWSAPALLGEAGNGLQDLEPKLAFSSSGQPYVVWWRLSADGVEQSVWMTTRSAGQWLEPARLTSTRMRASRPTVLIAGLSILVAFDTEQGIRLTTYSLTSLPTGGYDPAGGTDGADPPAYGGGGTGTRPPECPLLGCQGD